MFLFKYFIVYDSLYGFISILEEAKIIQENAICDPDPIHRPEETEKLPRKKVKAARRKVFTIEAPIDETPEVVAEYFRI